MEIRLACQPSHTLAYCFLHHGESVEVETGAMAMMSDGLSVQMGIAGGIGAAIRRKTFGGENALTVRYTANVEGAWVAVSSRYPGDMAEVEVRGSIVVERGAAVAWEQGVRVDVKYAGIRSAVMQEGLITLRLVGAGKAVLASYGGMQPFELAAGQEMIVDTGHLIAWDESVEMRIGMLGSATTASLSGEGLVARLKGPGRVWCQTRSVAGLEELLGQLGTSQERGR
jgi:uncharacterized protein (TIGR00266 family)